ncbi:MAG: ABC transporter substrate-binding protein [Sphingomonadaceae bacterium]|nr:ABC transporter substrate-binding protein [Sphingomonadaceae bacterium]
MRLPLASAGLLIAALSTLVGGAASSGVPRPASRPMRVMSINQCTDQIVLALLPPERIASVTWLSRDPDASLMAAAARRVAVNHGLVEEVVRDRPDLVVADSSSMPGTRALLKRLGWPMIEVDSADSIERIRAVTRRIARAVGEQVRSETLIAQMDRELASLAQDSRPPLRVAAWDGSGFGAEKGSLFDRLLRLSGAVNVANEPPASRYGTPDIEVLLAAAPDLLVQGSEDRGSLRDYLARHALVRRFWGNGRTLTVRQADYLCGTPFIAESALKLRRELRTASAAIRARLPFAQTGLR